MVALWKMNISTTERRSNMTNHPTIPRIEALMQAIAQAGLDAYLVPMVDEFQSEYIPASAARLPWVSGFTGSAGFGVFWAKPSHTHKHTLFVDGRYTLQAANEIDTVTIEILNSGEVSFTQWLSRFSQEELRIGFDPKLVTLQQYAQWLAATGPSVHWLAEVDNPVDKIWTDRPAPPSGVVHLHALERAGRSYSEKREALIAELSRHDANAIILTQPDAINWLLNIRGEDIPFNPLVLGYLLLMREGKATFYTQPRSLSAEVAQYFAAQEIIIADIVPIFAEQAPLLPKAARVMIDPAAAPLVWKRIADDAGWVLIEAEDPTQLPKALKNGVELDGIRAAHRRDGLALTRFLHWFDGRVASGKPLDEQTIVATLETFRAVDTQYQGASFATIAGSGPHGAIIHYRVDEKSNRRLANGELFLLDSGGQYPDGTTDVTRTLAVGTPTPAMKEHFTRVLKGHIALASAQFPAGTTGSQLDVLARQYLWAVGLDYDHGTGHGVGAYLCVHEGPQRISKRASSVALQPGMILSNEPGYYAAGQYGIRIESLVTVIEGATKGSLAFETLTLVPIDTRLVDLAMLSTDERNWLNNYHARVYKTHADALDSDARHWLEQATRAI
jgi:Xaa-Pro aminopeptidase